MALLKIMDTDEISYLFMDLHISFIYVFAFYGPFQFIPLKSLHYTHKICVN